MKTNNFKRILSTVLGIVLLLTIVAVISSCGAHEHSLQENVVVEPTCTGEGVMQLVCNDPECDYNEIETIPALGHDDLIVAKKDPTCTQNGHKAYSECKRCGRSTFTSADIIPAQHTKVTVKAEKPTCTKEGWNEWSHCADCDYVFVEKVTLSVLPHNLMVVQEVAPTCVAGHYEYLKCRDCSYTEYDHDVHYIAPIYDHVYSVNPSMVNGSYKLPTCTNDGGYDMEYPCTTCHTVAKDRYHVTFEALGHDMVSHDGKAATCTEYGWNAYTQCSRCAYGDTFVEILATGHTPEVVKGYDADCTNHGLTDGTKCSVCEEILVEQQVIPALGHIEVGTRENSVNPTCTAEGSYDKVVTCERCSVELDRQTIAIAALDHDYVVHDGKANNCLETGWAAYKTCTRCDYTDYQVIDALGHDIINHDAKAPDCTNIGWAAYDTCSRCSYTTYAEIPANGHTAVVDAAVAPDCLNTGLTEGSHCGVCNTVLVAQNTVDALGHNMNALNGTCQNAGCPVYFSVGLAYITNPDGTLTVENIGNCDDKNIIIPAYVDGKAVTSIKAKAFYWNEDITSVVIPDTVETIGDNAFWKCSNLKTVTIGKGVTYIGYNAFNRCDAISTVYYTGNAAEWAAIQIKDTNDKIKYATPLYI